MKKSPPVGEGSRPKKKKINPTLVGPLQAPPPASLERSENNGALPGFSAQSPRAKAAAAALKIAKLADEHGDEYEQAVKHWYRASDSEEEEGKKSLLLALLSNAPNP
jgi:hypothetical protein